MGLVIEMKFTGLPFFQHIKWRPDDAELRRFAISMLVGFSLLGLFAAWRGKGITTVSLVLWGVGLFLAMAAFVPVLGRMVYLGVYLPTSIIGYVVSHIILTMMFFLVITPVGLILRLMGKDPLQQRRPKHKRGWTPIKGIKDEDSYYRQF